MPSVSCLCGNTIRLSETPNPNGYFLRSEEHYERIVEGIVQLRGQEMTQDDFEWSVRRLFWPLEAVAPHVYECTHCGRLAVFARASDREVARWYIPEATLARSKPLASFYCRDRHC